MDAGDQVEGAGQGSEGDEPDHVGDLLVAVAKCPQFVDLALTPRTCYGMPAYAKDEELTAAEEERIVALVKESGVLSGG